MVAIVASLTAVLPQEGPRAVTQSQSSVALHVSWGVPVNWWHVWPDRQPGGGQLGQQALLLASSTCQSAQWTLQLDKPQSNSTYPILPTYTSQLTYYLDNLGAQITRSRLWPGHEINDQNLRNKSGVRTLIKSKWDPPCEVLGQWHTPFQNCRQGSLALTASPSCQNLPKQSAWSSPTSCSSSSSCTSSHFCPRSSVSCPAITWQCFLPESIHEQYSIIDLLET